MASSINASTTAGVVTTADTSAILQLQTGGTTAIAIDASQAVSFTNAPTVTGGTANGVAYLNGSKVLTTGSALVFDGTNLGVGVTPSAWTSPFKVIESGNGSTFQNCIAFQTNNNTVNLMGNCYYDGSYRFKYGSGSATASQFVVNSNSYVWNLASGGTAGGVATFTQAMTLDASGRLGIGTTSPSTVLSLASSNQPNHLYTGATGTFSWGQFNSSGDASINNGANANLLFATNNTERARIDSSGNLLVGTTSGGAKIVALQTAAASYGSDIRCNSATYTSVVLNIGADRNTTDGTYAMIQATRYGAATCFKVLDSGNVQNTNNSYGALSDIKLKENIVDATPKLADLMQVKVRSYNLKSDPLHKQLGVIAQELETVFPGLVDESPDYEQQIKTREVEVPAVAEVRDNEGNIVTEAVEATARTEEYTEQVALGTTTKAVKYSVFVPMLIKAMQEQQALITQLQADVALLKGA